MPVIGLRSRSGEPRVVERYLREARRGAGVEERYLANRGFSATPLVLLLPHETEGFYLPALEAMATGTQVICPDCVGNRSFCLDGTNCLRPRYKLGELMAAVRRALRMGQAERDAMLDAGQATAREHGLDREREQFHKLLAHCDVHPTK